MKREKKKTALRCQTEENLNAQGEISQQSGQSTYITYTCIL